MNDNDGNPQQPVGMAPPFGFMPNMQMMQQFFPPMQHNQMAGMQLNGPPAVQQMLPNFPMYLNAYYQMGGMQFHPMQALPMDGQMQMMPPMFNAMQMMPVMGAPMPQPGAPLPQAPQLPQPDAHMPQMGAQMPQPGPQMLPMGGQMPMMPQMGMHMPMMSGHHPIVQYVIVPVQMGMPMPFPPNAPMPAPIPIKKEMKEEDDDSVIECTPAFIATPAQPRRAFSIANILDRDQIKKEPTDDQDSLPTHDQESALANTATNSIVDRPIKEMHSSPIITDPVPPESAIPPLSSTPDEIPDTPASPEYRSHHDEDDRSPMIVPSQTVAVEMTASSVVKQSQSLNLSNSGVEEIRENAGGYDEFMSSADEGLIDTEEDLVSSPPTSKWKNFFKEHAKTDRLLDPRRIPSMNGESIETALTRRDIPTGKEPIYMKNVANLGMGYTKEEKREMKQEETKREKDTQDFTSNEPPSSTLFSSGILSSAVFREVRPSVPPRFPVRKERSRKESEDDSDRTSGSSSPWRIKGSPRKLKIEDRRRLAACSILVKDIPRRFDEEKILRYFRDKYGKCRLSRVYGHPSTVRIEFVSKEDRDAAFKITRAQINRETLTIHEDVVEEDKEERKEDKTPSRESLVLPPPRPQQQTLALPEIIFPLVKYQGYTGIGNRDIILTVGPIPRECSIRNIINYFRSRNGIVLDVPFPTHRPHEYLILRFTDLPQAKMVLAAQEHRVDRQVIPVSPPYDVHLGFRGLQGMDPREVPRVVVNMLHAECGIIVTMPTIKFKYDNISFGYVTFGRPQDARVAILKSRFTLEWGMSFDVFESQTNHTYYKYKEVWETKLRLEDLSKKVMVDLAKRTASSDSTTTAPSEDSIKRMRNSVRQFANSTMPMVTVGPIPSQYLKECEEYLLSRFDDVFHIPHVIPDRHFRVLRVNDPVVISGMMKEGYLRVGKTGERVLISPTFDVAFKSEVRGVMIDIKQLLPYVQRRYGPVLRDILLKHGTVKLTFGRYQDAQRAIDESPHFKSLLVMAREAQPNTSFAPFANTDMLLLINRSKEADRMEQAANIRVNCHGEGSNKGKRNRSMDGLEGGEVLVCSPVKKKNKPEDLRVMVRVSDLEQWIPAKNVLLRHFQQFGQVDACDCCDHLQAIIQFREMEQVRAATNQNRVKLGGLWLEVIPFFALVGNQQ